jgi:hypothetical protein
MIKEFRYTFDELRIVKNDITELLGFNDSDLPEPFPELIDSALKIAPSLCDIKGGYKIFNHEEISIDSEFIRIANQIFNPSKIVKTQFKNADSLALFISTAGIEITEHSKKISETGDPISGYIFDVLGSVTVEKAADKMLQSLETEIQKSGLKISDSFSPGYCEWSVAEQQKLFSLLPENFCGVSLSASSLMWPIKSVSGMVAIGSDMEHKGYQCYWCTDKDCVYGKIKRKKRLKKTGESVG